MVKERQVRVLAELIDRKKSLRTAMIIAPIVFVGRVGSSTGRRGPRLGGPHPSGRGRVPCVRHAKSLLGEARLEAPGRREHWGKAGRGEPSDVQDFFFGDGQAAADFGVEPTEHVQVADRQRHCLAVQRRGSHPWVSRNTHRPSRDTRQGVFFAAFGGVGV